MNAVYVNQPGPEANCIFLDRIMPVPPPGAAPGAVEDPHGEPWPLARVPTLTLTRQLAAGEELLVDFAPHVAGG